MRVNITVNNPNALDGYLNLDPIIMEAGIPKIKNDVSNLDEHLDDSECSELKSCNVLCYFEANRVDSIIRNWLKKIRKDGTIQFCEIDFHKVYNSFERGQISIITFNELLYGEQKHKWDFKKSILTLDVLEEALHRQGLKIVEKTFYDFNFLITAKRVK